MIGLYGHRNIDDNELREWILNWDDDKYIKYVSLQVNNIDGLEEVLKKQIQYIKSVASDRWLGEKGYFFDAIIKYLNQFMINCYFRASSSIASVANFHEILLEASDFHTKKQLIKGFDYVDKGNIEIAYDGEVIGNIGTMSDLFWHSFYDEYIIQDDYGGINHTRNNEEDFTLQIWKPKNLQTINEVEELVEKILYDCSVKLGLNFRRAKFDNFQKDVGCSNQYSLEVSVNDYERVPLQYFNFANYTSIARHKYLAYYQVIEFYFIRAMKQLRIGNSKELDYVNYIVNSVVEDNEVIEWLYTKEELQQYYCKEQTKYPSIVTLDLKQDLLALVAKRIYFIRCSLVHSKEAPIDANFIPNLNDTIVEKEVPLIKFIASKIIEKWDK